VVNSGAPVLLPWADDVAAVLVSWFPGQEFGNALADVLIGAVEPGGRLPVTWPASDEGLPPVTPVNGELPYEEGMLIGYRWYLATDRTPAFPFGYGLGYTTWAYEDMSVNGNTVTVTVRNSGTRAGREVVQVYASRADSRVQRPPRCSLALPLSMSSPEKWPRQLSRWAITVSGTGTAPPMPGRPSPGRTSCTPATRSTTFR